nr:MAG TPA: lytic transglycosylase [Caudoviricetes sp.]
MTYTVERRIRSGLPQVGYAPYRQVHAHSTGNPKSTADNEANFMQTKNINSGFYTHVVGNGKVIQVGEVGRGAWDVGGGWNSEGFASVELIESHANRDEFMRDYKIYCELLKDLAKQAGIPVTVDTPDLAGIKTHNFCTNNQPANGSDHVDPIPYLAKWGINLEQFRKDVTGASDSSNNNNTQESEMIDMFLINCKDTKNWYVCNGVSVKHIKTTRMLGGFQGKFGGIKLPEHVMFQQEMEQEYGKVK